MAPVASGPWQLLAEKVKMPGFGFGSIRLPRRKLPCVSGNEDEPKALLGCGEHVHIDCRAKGFETDYDLTGVILGKGCSGSVREVVCRKTGKLSAVKTFDVEDIFCAGGPDKLRDLQREVALQASINHPGVARVEAVYESKGFVRVVMERLEGGELFNRVSSYGPMGEREASELTFNLLKTVAYLHSQHIVHRDIKLENLIFEHSLGSNFKLIDFGFAASFEPGEKFTERCGTLQYMAPEVFKTSGYDEKVDIWSVGCTVYVMLTARSLYKGGETTVLEKSQEGKVDWSSRLDRFSDDARDFLFMLLNVDPSRRPSAEEALGHPWLERYASECQQSETSLLPEVAEDASTAAEVSDVSPASSTQVCKEGQMPVWTDVVCPGFRQRLDVVDAVSTFGRPASETEGQLKGSGAKVSIWERLAISKIECLNIPALPCFAFLNKKPRHECREDDSSSREGAGHRITCDEV